MAIYRARIGAHTGVYNSQLSQFCGMQPLHCLSCVSLGYSQWIEYYHQAQPLAIRVFKAEEVSENLI